MVLEKTAAEKKKQSKEEKLIKQKEQEAVQREAARQQHVRPWDKGKDSSRKRDHSSDKDDESEEEWQYKEEREPMSQEKWNELQRNQRKSEFAPMPENTMSHTSYAQYNRQPFVSARIVNEVSDQEDEEVDYDIQPPGTSEPNADMFADVEPSVHEFQSRSSSNVSKHKSFASSNSFASHRNKKPFVRRNEENRVTADDDEPVRHPEFAPPATFEYYGPSSSTQKPVRIKPEQLESSIEAGLKFLREQSDKDTHSTKMKWASNAGY